MKAFPILLCATAVVALASCSHDQERADANAPVTPTETSSAAPAPSSTPMDQEPAPQATPVPQRSASGARQPCVVADANRDGKVTKEEAGVDPNLVAAFDQYDTDQDGSLSREEWGALEQASLERHGQASGTEEAEVSRFEEEPCTPVRTSSRSKPEAEDSDSPDAGAENPGY